MSLWRYYEQIMASWHMPLPKPQYALNASLHIDEFLPSALAEG
uniref:Uncharacterized protein n=1 Tax=Trichinella nativa TaxID=6335 RepID=A0A0V1KHX0_9BILA